MVDEFSISGLDFTEGEPLSKGGIIKLITGTIIFLVLFTVALAIYTGAIDPALAAGDALNASGVPLGGLFASDGVVFVIIMASFFLVMVLASTKFMSGKPK